MIVIRFNDTIDAEHVVCMWYIDDVQVARMQVEQSAWGSFKLAMATRHVQFVRTAFKNEQNP